jgi:fructooligosaccharide transport system permease protein
MISSGNTTGVFSIFQRKKTTRERQRTNWFGYLFILPALLLYLVFNVWPLVRGFLMAFTDYRFFYPDTRWDFNGLNNFSEIIGDKVIRQAIGTTLAYVAIVMPLMLVLSLLLAVLISRAKRGEGFYRWFIYLPAILPVAVTYLIFQAFYNSKFGFINTVLVNFGVDNPPNWLGSPSTALVSIAIADLWRGIGFPTLLFLIGLYNISNDLYEAAAIDGASPWRQFWNITLPLLKPSLTLVLILNIGMIGVVEGMLVLTQGGPQNSTRTLGYYIYQTAFKDGDLRLGYAAAMSLVLGLISALFSLAIFRALRNRD